MSIDAEDFRGNARLAGVLFIAATTATAVSQTILEPILVAEDVLAGNRAARGTVMLGILLEAVNALASVGIAIALYSVLRRCKETAGIAYLGLRAIEGTLGVVAAAMLFVFFTGQETSALALELHDAAFLMVLVVFSISTLILYPTLYLYSLVPVWISLWGLIGGVMLLISCLLILWGRIEIGSTTDMILSIPIAWNEMVLALWLILRGFRADGLTRLRPVP